MNALYTQATRQSSKIQQDIARLESEEATPALTGQIAALLAALGRTIEDYEGMAKREMIQAKQEKAFARVQKFREDLVSLRAQFEQGKAAAADRTAALNRSELLSVPSTSGLRPRTNNPFSPTSATAESPFPSSTPSPVPDPLFLPNRATSTFPGLGARDAYNLREHQFARDTDVALDGFIAQGMAVLDGLMEQRGTLKRAQRRLLDAANSIGVGRQVIGFIERRSRQDIHIFYAGSVLTLAAFFAIWWFLG